MWQDDVSTRENDLTLDKIALISNEFPPYMFGGIGTQCYDLAFSLSKQKFHVKVLTGGSKQMRIERIGRYLEVFRMPFIDAPPRSIWFQLQNLVSLLKLLKDCSVVHIEEPRDSIILSYFKKRLSKPIISSVHEVPQQLLKAVAANYEMSNWTLGDVGYYFLQLPLNVYALRSTLKNSDHVIACGRHTLKGIREFYGELPQEKASVIYNGINFDKIRKITSPKRSGGKIVFFGRLCMQKGVLPLVRALSLISAQFPAARLEIFGTGPSRRKIEYLISMLGLECKVHLRGFVPYTQLIREIQEADLVALPSFHEVGPFIAALEAMACSKPVVGFDLPFMREFICHMRNGLVARCGSVEELAQQILVLLSNRELCRTLGQNAYEYVKKMHNWDTLVHDYIKIYEAATQL